MFKVLKIRSKANGLSEQDGYTVLLWSCLRTRACHYHLVYSVWYCFNLPCILMVELKPCVNTRVCRTRSLNLVEPHGFCLISSIGSFSISPAKWPPSEILGSVCDSGRNEPFLCYDVKYVIDLVTLLAYLFTYCVEQNPSWETNRFSARQEIPFFLRNHEGSLPHSQMPATCLYPELTRSSPYSHIPLHEGPLLFSHLRLTLPSGLFPSGFSPLFSPIRATCPTHLLLGLISRTTLGEEYSSLSSSSGSFLHSQIRWTNI